MKANLIGRVLRMERGQTADFVQVTLEVTGAVENHKERAAKTAKMSAVLFVTQQIANTLSFGSSVKVVVETTDPEGVALQENTAAA